MTKQNGVDVWPNAAIWMRFGAKFAEEGVDRCKPNLNVIWE